RAPFRAETTLAVLRRITDTQPRAIREVNPATPEWLERIISRLHEKLPENRFGSANEVADLLEHCLAHVQQPTVMPLPNSVWTMPTTSKSVASSASIMKWLIASVVIGLAAIGGWELLGQLRGRQRELEAERDKVTALKVQAEESKQKVVKEQTA